MYKVRLTASITKSLRQEENPIVVTVDEEGTITINEIALARDLLIQELQQVIILQ